MILFTRYSQVTNTRTEKVTTQGVIASVPGV